jgi:pimeloyl-ACP methyl ester carboxylesterase
MTPGSFGHVDIVWEDPVAALFLRTLASFSQVIRFDRRGTGASDPVPLEQLPPWESYAEDLDVVLDQVGAERTAVMAAYDAGPMAMFFAATRPQRTSALILANTTARWVAADGCSPPNSRVRVDDRCAGRPIPEQQPLPVDHRLRRLRGHRPGYDLRLQ